jgi:hypothetical protein
LEDEEFPRIELYEHWCKTCKHEEKEYVEPPCDECFKYFVEVKNHEPVQE